MKIVITLLLAFVLSACATHGKPITQAQIDQIKQGVTTKEQLFSSFGEPIAVSKNSDGTEIYAWAYAHAGFGGSNYQNRSISVVLSPDGRVSSYTTSAIGKP